MTVIRSLTEGRAYAAARGDSTASTLSDGALPSYLASKYGVAFEGEPATAVRVDAAPSREYRTDAKQRAPKFNPMARYKQAFAASYRGDEQSADAKERAARGGDTNIETHPETNPVTGQPLTSYERYRRDYYAQRAKTATRDLLAPSPAPAPAPQGAALAPAPIGGPSRRDAKHDPMARYCEAHADRSHDASDPSARGQAPASSAKADPTGFFAKCQAAFEASRGKVSQ